MTPKEKAQELVDKFSDVEIMFESQIGSIKYDELGNAAKQCALIAVDEINDELDTLTKPEYTLFITRQATWVDGGLAEEAETSDGYERRDFWQKVKTEIQNL